MERQMEPCQLIERSIIKKYRKELWTPFIVAVKRYELVQAGDKIAVCISGGKDSMLMAKLMQELQRHSDVPFELVFLVMDPGYNEINRQILRALNQPKDAPNTQPNYMYHLLISNPAWLLDYSEEKLEGLMKDGASDFNSVRKNMKD